MSTFYTATVGRSVATNLQPEGYWLGVLTTSYGINLNHTLRLRAEYQEGPQEESLIVAEHSARWLRDVITNIQVAPTKYEQFNVTYQSMNSNFFNGYFNNYRGTYRTINNNLDFQYGFSGFVNLPNRFIPLFVRAGVDNSEYTDLSLRSYNANVTTRFRTLSVSGGFRSLQRIVAGQTLSQNRYTLTTSYSTPRTTDVWAPASRYLLPEPDRVATKPRRYGARRVFRLPQDSEYRSAAGFLHPLCAEQPECPVHIAEF